MLFRSKAAENGHVQAHVKLGDMYFDGRGVAADYDEAMSWYRKALKIDAENGEALSRIGSMYYEGKGVEQDYKEAAEWFRKAADREIFYAQYTLGTMYEKGLGVPQDYSQAYVWFSIGYKLGSKHVENDKDRVAKNLSSEQKEAADKKVEEWINNRYLEIAVDYLLNHAYRFGKKMQEEQEKKKDKDKE